MYRFNVILASFDGPFENFERLSRVVAGFVEALARANLEWLAKHPETPALYQARIKYVEDTGSDDWCDIPEVLKRGIGDCDDFAAWRLAELWRMGEREAKAAVDVTKQGDRITYHAFILRANGTPEDPAALISERKS